MTLVDLLFYLIYASVSLLVSVVVLLAGSLWYFRPFKVDPNIPGPKRTAIIGVTFEEESTQAFDEPFHWGKWPTLSLELSRRWNFRTWGGPTLNIGFGGAFFNVVSPECLQHILKDNFENYEKGELTASFRELMGEAIFTTDGDLWKFHRKIVTTILSRETVKHAASLMKEKLSTADRVLQEKAEAQDVFDFQDFCYKLVFDVFANLAFGVELNQVNSMAKDYKSDETQQMMDEFTDAFDRLQYYTHLRFADLLWKFKQKYAIGEREQKVVRCQKIIDKFSYGIIRKALNRPIGDDTKQLDVVHQFIQYCRNQNENDPTERELRDFVMTFVLAGRDTTSVALAWTIFELTKHPAVVSSIREEVDQLQKESAEDAYWTYDFVDKLNYTQAVVMEALRLHSPAPDNFRFAIEDDVLPDGTNIPAKSLVMFSAYTINHSNKVWGDNSDEFDPSRFLNCTEPSPMKYPTFNAGPRLCPGKPLALMELKMVVAYLTSKFDFEDASQHSGDFDWKLVLAMKDGFPVKVTQLQS